MSSFANPLFSGNQPQGTNVPTGTNFNPLFGWQGTNPAGTGMPSAPIPGTSPIQGNQPIGTGQQTGSNANPFGLANPANTGSIARNINLSNLSTANMKNQMIPQLWQLFSATGGDAASFFKMLTDLGGPYYQQKQRQTFEQGTKSAQDAAAQSRQQLSAVGAGYTPSGAGAAMFGGEAQAEAGNQEEAFLNNLFQNEQLQATGAGGLASLAQTFNPAAETTSSAASQPYQAPTFAQQFQQIMNGIFGGGQSAQQLVGVKP